MAIQMLRDTTPPTPPIPTNGLLGYWQLQSDLLDYSGNGCDGSWAVGTGSFTVIGGKTGAEFTGDGTGTVEHIITTLNYGGPTVTMCGWIYFTDLTSYYSRWNGIMTNSMGSDFISLGCRTSMSNKWTVGYPGNHLTSSVSGTTGAWTFVAGTVSSSGAKVYVNGSLVGSNSVSYTTAKGSIWELGCCQDHGGGGSGYIRHCAVYNRELSASEISDFYSATI